MLVTALPDLAKSVGANRVVEGRAVQHPFGDPSLEPEKERNYRAGLLLKALEVMTVAVSVPTVFLARAES